ncbi:MAG TPA: DUF4282 domain-containing protein [Saprospiraceae bacterium]|nr:DUF4282 domain-containing protein [Saprospiraceae bacterium]
MITPTVVKLLFWIMVLFCVITGGMSLFASFQVRNGGSILLITGLAWIIIGPLAARVWCEILIVIFAINDTLTDIRNSIKDKVLEFTASSDIDNNISTNEEISEESKSIIIQPESQPYKTIIDGKEFVVVACPKCKTINHYRASKEGSVEHCIKCDYGFVVPCVR